VPQRRPVVAVIAAAIVSVTVGGVDMVAHASDSAARARSLCQGTAVAPPESVTLSSSGQQRPAVTPSLDRHRLVNVAVANVWVGPHKPRRIDAPSLRQPMQVARWLRDMNVRQRRDLTPRLDTQLRYGDDIVLIRQQGVWSKVRIPNQVGGRFPNGIKGWVVSRQLASRPADWRQHSTVASVTALKAPLTWRSGDVARTLRLSYATTLPVVAASPDDVTVELPGTALIGSLPRSAVAVHPIGTPAIRPSGAAVVAQARRFLGLPYLWAGMSAWGFDCSGLTTTVLGQLGVRLPRDAADQSTVGRRISRHHLRPGDLVFFSYQRQRWGIHHVAIYVGHGRVIESPYSGARVRIRSLWHSYLGKEYWGATRPLT
jgi:cell wall-associated NlpC family hydrolase